MSTGMRSFPASAAGKSAKAVAVFHGLALIAFFAASSAPTPLYRFYQEKWSFSPVVLTVIFGAYALALLLALLTMGSLSDHVGRKPVIFGALLLQIVAMALFITADGVPSLIIARVVQGFSTGMAGSAFGAALIDVDRDRGALANSLTPLLGMAFGALGSSALVDFAPRPMQLVYLVLLVVFAIQAALVVFLPETVVKRPGALASLVPRINVPMQARRALLRCSPIIIAVWALGGFYLSLVPSLVRASTGLTSPLIGGFVVCVLTLSGCFAIMFLRHLPSSTILTLATSALTIGISTILIGVGLGAPWLLVIGTMIAGLGHGSGFLASMSILIPLARADERAGLLSAIYIESYLAFSLPAILAGFASLSLGLVRTTDIYGGTIIVLALIAFAAARMSARQAKHP